jgi:hypothetical protein
MKKILASIVALTAVTGFASVAHAAGGPEGSATLNTPSADVTSVHGGNVLVQCTIKATDGILLQTSPNVIDSSGTPGVITTKCNTTTSKLITTLTASTQPTVVNPAANNYAPSYKLNGGTGAYAAAGSGVYSTAANTYVPSVGGSITVTDIANGLVNADSTVNVVARGEVDAGKQLVAGAYKITVTNTVTP